MSPLERMSCNFGVAEKYVDDVLFNMQWVGFIVAA